MVTLQFDASGMTSPTLEFDYAYATYSTEADQLDIYYSTNNGSTWTLLLNMPGGVSGILNTGGVVTTEFAPNAQQWATRSLTLPNTANRVKFTATSAYGNNLFLDNIKVKQIFAHDAGVSKLDPVQVYPLGTVSPVATIKNYGTSTETFNVTMTIGTSYTSTKAVTSLASGASTLVTFDPWANSSGDYRVQVCTQLATDQNTGNNCMSHALKVMTLNKLVYAYNAFAGTGTDPEGPTTFNLNAPGILNSLADQSTLDFVSGGTWANGIWYGTVLSTATPYNFISLDPATGSRTVIGDMGHSMNGLSYNPADNKMYAVDPTSLYTIDIHTGAATLVGTNTGISMLNLAINTAGAAYTMDMTGANLGTVNLATGAFTPVGPVGFAPEYAQDMEFDRETGELYMTAQDATSGWLAWVDKTTGNTMKIGDFEGGAEVTGFAIPYSSGKTLNLTNVRLEGFYTGISDPMNVSYDDMGEHWPAGVTDHITVELHDAASYATIVYSVPDVELTTAGTATITVPAAFAGNYYITVKHRNSLETVSANPVSFAGTTMNKSFGTPADVFYGNLAAFEDGGYAIYGGDPSQDGLVDSSDMEVVDNLSSTSASGYIPEDCNGDGLIDSSDMAIIDNNSAASLGAATP